MAVSPFLLVSGQQAGPITREWTEVELKRAFGARHVLHERLYYQEGESAAGLMVYRVAVYRPENRILRIATDNAGRAVAVEIYDERFHTASGIRVGMTLLELERRNGGPFQMYGFAWDHEGLVVGWNGGRLAKEVERIGVTLLPVDRMGRREVQGDGEFRSDHPVLRKMNPRVARISMSLEP